MGAAQGGGRCRSWVDLVGEGGGGQDEKGRRTGGKQDEGQLYGVMCAIQEVRRTFYFLGKH